MKCVRYFDFALPSRRSWNGHVVEQIPDERIAWKSEGGAKIQGVVTFHSLDIDLTRVLLQMEYKPTGAFEWVGNTLRIQRRRAKRDLRLFKHFIELRGEETGAWRGQIDEDDKLEPLFGGQGRVRAKQSSDRGSNGTSSSGRPSRGPSSRSDGGGSRRGTSSGSRSGSRASESRSSNGRSSTTRPSGSRSAGGRASGGSGSSNGRSGGRSTRSSGGSNGQGGRQRSSAASGSRSSAARRPRESDQAESTGRRSSTRSRS